MMSGCSEAATEYAPAVVSEFFGMTEIVNNEEAALYEILGLGLPLDAILGPFHDA
jgi:hypothetical protein